MRQTIKRNRFVIGAFFCAMAIMGVTYAVRGIYPFGDRTILKVDLYHQYAPYLEELRSRLLKGESLLYSWEGGLGKDFLSQMAYYTASPLCFLILLFPQKHLPEAMALLILLKTCLCAGTFTWYLKARFRKNDLSILIFGLLYAFCAFMTCYYWNVMWLDTVYLFPLVAYGLRQLILENKHILYYVSLTLTMVVNFYLAVLVCVLTACYYLVTLFSNYSVKADWRLMLRRTGKFAFLSILCAMSAMFVLAPVAQALGATATSKSSFPSFEVYKNVYQLFSSHFLGARDAVLARNEDLPNVYTGVFTMLLLPAYYFNKKIRRKEKGLVSLLLVFMLLCSCIKPLDYLIHGLHFPSNLPHRFTFIYSFILLSIAYQEFLNLKECKFRFIVGAGALYAALLLVSEYVVVPKIDDIDRVLSDTDIAVNMVMIAFYVFYLYLASGRRIGLGLPRKAAAEENNGPEMEKKGLFGGERKKAVAVAAKGKASAAGKKSAFGGREKRLAGLDGISRKAGAVLPTGLLVMLMVAVVFEAGFSSITNLHDTGDRTAYVKYMDDTEDAVAYLDEREDGNFYRTEFRRFTTINDAALYHYNGFSQFSSLSPGGISALIQHLGIAATSNSYRYYDPTPLIDAMFGLKYVMNKDEAHPKAEKYTFLKQFGTVYVYENERSLPLGFLVNSEISDWQTTNSQPFAVQNDFVKKAAGVSDEMLTAVAPTSINHSNMQVTENGSAGNFSYTLDHPEDLSLLPTVTADYTVTEDTYLYLYVNAPNAKRFIYSTSTNKEDRELSAGRSLIDVGWVSAGETVHVEFSLTNHGQFEKTYRKSGSVQLYAAAYHDDVFQEAYDKLESQPYTITEHSDTKITGTVDAAEDCVLFTSIPYTKGWEVTVDGETVEKLSIGDDGLVGVSIPAGEHTVVFTYRSRILLPAVIVSLAGVGIFVIYCRRQKKRLTRTR